jgi:hypothetical protein
VVIANGVSGVLEDGYHHLTEHLPTFRLLLLGQAAPQIQAIVQR